MIEDPVLFAKLVCVARLFDTPPAFALPVFSETGTNGHHLIQDVTPDGTIRAFVPVDLADLQVHMADEQLVREVGQPALLAFETTDERLHIAERSQLRATLREFLSSPNLAQRLFTRAAVAEFCNDLKVATAAELEAAVRLSVAPRTASYYRIGILARERIKRALDADGKGPFSGPYRLLETERGLQVEFPRGVGERDVQRMRTALYRCEAELVAVLNKDKIKLECRVGRRGGKGQQGSLVGIGTRESFRATFNRALDQAKRVQDTLALLVLDLNGFQLVNNTLGHTGGDLLIRRCAERFRACVRETDTVARIGGDKFAIVQVGLEQPDGARALCRRLLDTLAAPVDLDGNEVLVTASIGVALFPTDGSVPGRLLQNADIALNRAKEEGRNTFRFFAAEMNRTARRTGLLEREFRQGLAGEQFTVHFQPQLELRGGRIIGAEVLVRWRHPKRGLIRPGEFIPLAEDTGLIAPLTVWVLRRAFRQFQGWLAEGFSGLRLSVNLSPVQFRERGTELMIERILDETGLDPAYLDIELTESGLSEIGLTESEVAASTEAAGASLRHLHERGVTLSIDDFGTGYSSLAYLQSLPVHRLKIDRSFIGKLGENAFDEAIVRAIIDLAHRLNLRVLAEGVETKGQLRRLRQLDCDEMQGDLFCPAVPAEEFRALFLRHGGRARRSIG